jgi:2-polyprenyl-3-methyl-5-hydroxy-6-metoxy-1,4-benzoquinol methylase
MPSVNETVDYFDRKAGDLTRSSLVDKWSALEPLLGDLPPGRAIVECGAGTGLYTIPMARSGHTVRAVDLSASSLAELARSAAEAGLADRVATVHGDFRQVIGEMDPVDVVTFIKVLHHFPDQPAIAQALEAAWASLAPGGRIVLFEPNGLSPVWPVLFRLRGAEVWEAERNTLLMRAPFLGRVLRSLPGATVRQGYRYLVPGTVATRSALIDRLDRRLVAVPGLRGIACNLWFAAEKPR